MGFPTWNEPTSELLERKTKTHCKWLSPGTTGRVPGRGSKRTLTVSNWAGGRGIPMTTLAPYREAPYTIGIGGKLRYRFPEESKGRRRQGTESPKLGQFCGLLGKGLRVQPLKRFSPEPPFQKVDGSVNLSFLI